MKQYGTNYEVHALDISNSLIIPRVCNKYISKSLFQNVYGVSIIYKYKLSLADREFQGFWEMKSSWHVPVYLQQVFIISVCRGVSPKIVVRQQLSVSSSVFFKLCLKKEDGSFIHLLEISVVSQVVLFKVIYFLFDICEVAKVQPFCGSIIWYF